ncbi:MAG: hypothetical protein U1E93_06130 [Alphaproteobacteria bacterium]
MPSKPWPRWAGALTGCIFLVLFVCLPPLRKAGYQPEMLHYLLVPGAIAGGLGALAGWGLVVVRNRLMIH